MYRTHLLESATMKRQCSYPSGVPTKAFLHSTILAAAALTEKAFEAGATHLLTTCLTKTRWSTTRAQTQTM